MSKITEQVIESWDDFDEIVKKRSYRKWIYRGQVDATWKLESSLFRAFREVQILHKKQRGKAKSLNRFAHEATMIERFKSNAHLYLSHLPEDTDYFSWLAVMQHHGAPSRLLDFTFSPYVAAFFSLECGTEDAAIYSLEHAALKRADEKLFEQDPSEIYQNIMETNGDEDEAFIYTFEPKFSNARLMAQQGLFLMPNFLNMSHEGLLEDYPLSKRHITKYIIPSSLRAAGIRHLHQMNITASLLYPGLDGFCKSMKFQPLFGLNYQQRVE